jgi:hypothetical protein
MRHAHFESDRSTSRTWLLYCETVFIVSRHNSAPASLVLHLSWSRWLARTTNLIIYSPSGCVPYRSSEPWSSRTAFKAWKIDLCRVVRRGCSAALSWTKSTVFAKKPEPATPAVSGRLHKACARKFSHSTTCLTTHRRLSIFRDVSRVLSFYAFAHSRQPTSLMPSNAVSYWQFAHSPPRLDFRATAGPSQRLVCQSMTRFSQHEDGSLRPCV